MSIKKSGIRKSGFIYRSWDRFRKNRLSLLGFAIFLIFFSLGVLCPYLPIQDPMEQNWGYENVAPNERFIFGTDSLGRDLFSRLVWGARTSLIIGFESVLIMTIVGVLVGAFSGFMGGKIDNIIMRGTDIFLGIPRLVLLIVIASVLRTKSIFFTGFIIGITSWPRMSRVVRSSFLSMKSQQFVEAAESMGAPKLSIMFNHILPNSISPIIVIATISIGDAIISEAGLSFLGLGDPFIISWGQMLRVGNQLIRRAWWNAVYPGLAIFFTTLGFNLMGDGLRDAFDVRM
jgi:peptide/nickel transport system permease protein